MTYVLDKSRLSIRLVPPYSEERKAAASAYEMCIRDRTNIMKTILISTVAFIIGGFSGIVTICLVQSNRVNGNERFEEDDFDEERY